MRRLFTTQEALATGITRAELAWGAGTGRWRRAGRGVYAEGPGEPTALDCALAPVVRVGGVACGHVAGVLLGLDSVPVHPWTPPRSRIPADRIIVVEGIRCTDGLQTLVDLAASLDDDTWEQALESALRARLTSVAVIEDLLPVLGRSRTPGTARIRRVLARRPAGARATGSLLETLMIQLARTVPGVPELDRQVRVENAHGDFVADVDLAAPSLGFFLELDGQQHKGQPVYDARRETAVVAATGWLCGRFTWREVVHLPRTTSRRLAAIAEQAARRRRAV